MLDELIPEAGAFYIMDRAYTDFKRLYSLNLYGAYFVVRAKRDLQYLKKYLFYKWLQIRIAVLAVRIHLTS